MIIPGLVSVTFRQLTPEEVIQHTAAAGLQAIEWGGDIHVPHGQLDRAVEVRDLTLEANLQIAAYGSYYRVGVHDTTTPSFSEVLETALALGAPTIRIWAGNRGSSDADEAWWETVVLETERIAAQAAAFQVSLSFEYHRGTLTDTHQSAYKLLQRVHHPNIRTLWQPPVGSSQEEGLAGLRLLLPWIQNIHAFHWLGVERQPLSEGRHAWTQYLGTLHQHLLALQAQSTSVSPSISRLTGNHYALLEFIRGDDLDQFYRDARTLQAILNSLS